MSFCPLDYRYGDEDFKRIWSELGRHERQLEVERALIWAHMQLGKVSKDDYDAVAAIANPDSVTKERVSEIEAEILASTACNCIHCTVLLYLFITRTVGRDTQALPKQLLRTWRRRMANFHW